LVKADNARSDYLSALRAADNGDYSLLLVFVRSTATPEKKRASEEARGDH
jgi:hypothetical protein